MYGIQVGFMSGYMTGERSLKESKMLRDRLLQVARKNKWIDDDEADFAQEV